MTGLPNIGGRCHLSTMPQILLHIEEIRSRLLRVTDSDAECFYMAEAFRWMTRGRQKTKSGEEILHRLTEKLEMEETKSLINVLGDS
jgi:hypothetical protein